jgi:peptidoglycan LD-endopeptidase LytH
MSGKRRSSVLSFAVAAVVLTGGLAGCGSASQTGSVPVWNAPVDASGTSSASPSALPSPSAPSASPSAKPSPSKKPSTKPSKATTASTAQAKPGTFVFPVVGKYSYAHTHHDYPATDIITACGNEVRAATSGVILEVTRVDTWKASVDAGATRGGLSVSIKGDDGLRYYGSHMEQIDSNIQPGVRVTAGEQLGKIGRTGDASACHLHFGISPVCKGVGDWWIQRGVIWPWPYLDSWRKGGEKSPVAEIASWSAKYGCPTKPLTDP